MGADLSGGLDSATAVLLAAAVGPVRAVTYTDGHTSGEDTTYAARVAEHAGHPARDRRRQRRPPPLPVRRCAGHRRAGRRCRELAHGPPLPRPRHRQAAALDRARRGCGAGREQRRVGRHDPAGRGARREAPCRVVGAAAWHRAGAVLEGAAPNGGARAAWRSAARGRRAGSRLPPCRRPVQLGVVPPGRRSVLADPLRPRSYGGDAAGSRRGSAAGPLRAAAA
ncbi:asparagine synthase-related protein [Streptomyces somaliensis]|nr:asparagine synthase-related protein [Streptomyces somaliensis]